MGVRSFLIGILIAAGVLWSLEYGSAPGVTESGAFKTAAMTAIDPSDQEIADAARIAMQDQRPAWESSIADVDYRESVLRVALQTRADGTQDVKIAQALAKMVRSPDARLLWSIETIEITDGAGVILTELSA